MLSPTFARLKIFMIRNSFHTSLLFLFFISSNSFSQSVTFSGYVTDLKTGERLIGANVFEPVRKIGTSTNAYGFYSITINGKDSAVLMASYVGYSTQVNVQSVTADKEINFLLESSITLSTVVINGARGEQIQERSQMSQIDLTMDKIKNIPALFG
jgi:hypothetical protein